MHKYYFKNFILTFGLVMLSFIVLGSVFLAIGRNYMVRERESAAESNAADLATLAQLQMYQGRLSDLEFRISVSMLAQATSSHCFITDPDGTVISCSDGALNCPHIGMQLSAAVLKTINASGGSHSELSTLYGFYPARRFVAGNRVNGVSGETAGYAFVGVEASETLRAWDSLMYIFFLTAFGILLIALLLSFVLSKRQSKSVTDMARAASKFAHGDFTVRVDEDRDDELGALAASFNGMAESLERSEKRRSEFIANIAHELKTPMTTISGFADGILDGTIPPENSRRYLETISSETKRLNRLVRSMLDLSRMQSKDGEALLAQTFDINEMLLQTLIVFERRINEKNLDVQIELPEESMQVRGDPDSINRVVYNLLENAVKFAPEGGLLGVSLWKRDGKAYVSVKNSGDTIPEDELTLIFDRFHKTDKSRSQDRDGVGLGLYIVKSILNAHREDIAVTSRDGVTEFVFTLSLAG